jgi:hypothetical protein
MLCQHRANHAVYVASIALCRPACMQPRGAHGGELRASGRAAPLRESQVGEFSMTAAGVPFAIVTVTACDLS